MPSNFHELDKKKQNMAYNKLTIKCHWLYVDSKHGGEKVLQNYE